MAIISSRKLKLMDSCILLYPLLLFIESKYFPIEYIDNNAIFFFLIYFSAAILGGLPSLIHYIYYAIKSRPRNSNQKTLSNRKAFPLVYITHDHKKKCFSLVVIFCLSFINIVYVFIYNFSYKFIKIKMFFFYMIFDSFFIYAFSYFILKISLYKHHYLGIGAFFIGLFAVNWNFIKDYEHSKMLAVILVITFGLSIPLALISVASKQIMEKKYLHPMTFLIIYGVFGMIIIGIIYLISLKCFEANDYVKVYIIGFPKVLWKIFGNWISVIRFFSHILLRTFLSLGFFIIIYYWNPLDETLLRQFSMSYLVVVFYLLSFNFNYLFYLLIFGMIFTLSGILIYFELIIFYFWRLEENTNKVMQERGERETDSMEHVVNANNEGIIEYEGNIQDDDETLKD